MSDSQNPNSPAAGMGGGEDQSTLFAHLVLQQSHMAMMLLGKVPHPETGQVTQDLEAARLFIDMLEMIEAKTKGNLNKEEAGLLRQNLMALRLAFVEAVEGAPEKPEARPEPSQPAAESQSAGQPSQVASPADAAAAAESESHKKFTKKY